MDDAVVPELAERGGRADVRDDAAEGAAVLVGLEAAEADFALDGGRGEAVRRETLSLGGGGALRVARGASSTTSALFPAFFLGFPLVNVRLAAMRSSSADNRGTPLFGTFLNLALEVDVTAASSSSSTLVAAFVGLPFTFETDAAATSSLSSGLTATAFNLALILPFDEVAAATSSSSKGFPDDRAFLDVGILLTAAAISSSFSRYSVAGRFFRTTAFDVDGGGCMPVTERGRGEPTALFRALLEVDGGRAEAVDTGDPSDANLTFVPSYCWSVFS